MKGNVGLSLISLFSQFPVSCAHLNNTKSIEQSNMNVLVRGVDSTLWLFWKLYFVVLLHILCYTEMCVLIL